MSDWNDLPPLSLASALQIFLTQAAAAAAYQPRDATLTTLSGKALQGSGAIVLAASPTIVTPTILSLTNMQHSHQNAAGGGTLNAAAIAVGTLALARGGTNADLSGSGSATAILAQDASHVISARALVAADIPATLNALQVTLNDNDTVSAGTVFSIAHDNNAGGTPAIGYGVNFRFLAQSGGVVSPTNDRLQARIVTGWTDPTDATRTASISFTLANLGGTATVLTLNPTAATLAGVLTSTFRDAVTNAVVDVANFFHTNSGTAVDGIGVGVNLGTQSSSGASHAVARLQGSYPTANEGTRKGRLDLIVVDTNDRLAIRMDSTGSAAAIGFLGAAAAIRQTGGSATAGATYTATEQGMLQKAYDALRTFGFLT